MRVILWILMALVVTLAPGLAVGQEKLRLALITPHSADTPFWKSFTEFAGAAARDLAIELEAHHAHFDREQYQVIFAKLAKRTSNRPRAVIVKSERGLGLDLLKIAEAAKLPIFFVNSALTAKERSVYGGPRKHFNQWLGEVLPDNEGAGFHIAQNLIRTGLNANRLSGKKLVIAGLSGQASDFASQARLRGLKRGVASYAQVALSGIRSGGWVRGIARERAGKLLEKYPEINLFWAANDDMALGAVDALRDRGRSPGRDAFVGGMNWRPEAIAAVRSGSLAFSLGGHFMEGAWAVVLLHDYFRGKDFSDLGVSHRSPWGLISSANVAKLGPLLSNQDWDRIDFRRFSRVRNPKLAAYDFSFKNVLVDF